MGQRVTYFRHHPLEPPLHQFKPLNGSGSVVAGPFDVGELGLVRVVEYEVGEKYAQKCLYAEFARKRRTQRIPLAAVAALVEQMGLRAQGAKSLPI